MVTAQEILKAAEQLPDAERVALIEALLASFEPSSSDEAEVAEAWRKVAAERAAELDRGEVQSIPWDEVRREGESRLHGRSAD